MVELATLVEVGVAVTNAAMAVGTIFLAIVAYRSLGEGKRQLKQVSRQTEIFRSQQDPFLKVQNFRFEGDTLVLDVENMGKGRAVWVGIESWFWLVYPRTYADREGRTPISYAQVEQGIAKGEKLVWTRFEMDTKTKLGYKDWKETFPTTAVTFLVNSRVGDAIIEAGEKCHFEVQPFFEVKNRAVDASEMKGSKFDELKQILKACRVRFVALELTSVCKDPLMNNVPGESFCKFVVDLDAHPTLESAFQKRIDFHFVPLGPREVAKMGFIDGDFYEGVTFGSSPDTER